MNRFLLSVFTLASGFSFAQTTNPAPYCDASFDDHASDDWPPMPVQDAVVNVTFGTLSNNSGGQFAEPHYVFYTNLQAPALQKGNAYPLSLGFEVHGGCGYGVWIDYNHNNQFEANEKIAGTAAGETLELSDNAVVNATIMIPETAATGTTRMRVRIVEDDEYNMAHDFVTAPCNEGTTAEQVMDWGETEDYVVNITAGTVGLDEFRHEASLSLNGHSLIVDGVQVKELHLFAMNGQEVRTAATPELDLSGLTTGMYLLKVFTAEGNWLDYKIVR